MLSMLLSAKVRSTSRQSPWCKMNGSVMRTSEQGQLLAQGGR